MAHGPGGDYPDLPTRSGSARGRNGRLLIDARPAGLSTVDLSNPQSWNAYSYALNNPATNTDPSGLDCAYLTPGGTTIKQGGISQLQSQQECSNSGGYWVPGTLTDFSLGANGNYVFSSVTQGSGGELAEHTTQYAPTPDAISPEVDPIMLLLGA